MKARTRRDISPLIYRGSTELSLHVKDLRPALQGYSAEEVSRALRALCKEQRIRWGHPVNDIYFMPL